MSCQTGICICICIYLCIFVFFQTFLTFFRSAIMSCICIYFCICILYSELQISSNVLPDWDRGESGVARVLGRMQGRVHSLCQGLLWWCSWWSFGDGGDVQVSIVEQGDRPQLELDSHQVADCLLYLHDIKQALYIFSSRLPAMSFVFVFFRWIVASSLHSWRPLSPTWLSLCSILECILIPQV